MGQDATKVLLGATQSSLKKGSEIFASDPATYLAGLAVRRTSAGLLSVTKSAGRWAGISLGKSLSDHKKTTVLHSGLRVPVLLERQPARGEITITSYANLVSGTDDSVTVGATVFTFQTGAVTLGQTTARAATSNAATATSLAAQINAHATAGALVVASIDPDDDTNVIITSKSNTTSGDTIALAYTDNDSNIGLTVSGATLTDSDDTADYVQIGANAYFSDTTGKADDPNSGATVSNAVYVSGVLTGVDEDGAEVAVAIVDMQGGL
jgi:hypothetical protein